MNDSNVAIELATCLLVRARQLQSPSERRQQAELDRMVGHEADKATLVQMTDQAFRAHCSARVADQLTHILDVQGVPRFFSPVEQAMLRGFQAFGQWLPGVAVPLVKEKMRHETANVILPAEPELLTTHLADRQEHEVTMNVNLLGEALMGDEETRRRMQAYYDLLRLPTVRCISVKLTTLHSQVSPLARRHTIEVVSDRLETLYRTANRHQDAETGQGKFIYLDMEEYRDLHLTADVLCETLDRRGLKATRAGIALQAYIPDSAGVMDRLIEWSRRRVERGGFPLTIRLVKGANLEMERVVASIAGWPLPCYSTKRETDTNFKSMLRKLIDSAATGSIRVGVASHNLFDVALAMLWTDRVQAEQHVQFEMLEGMANHQRRAITEAGRAMLLYAPACRKSDFLHAIGYLIRRLDENTGVENFLRYSYRLEPGSAEFQILADAFTSSLQQMNHVSQIARRTQNRKFAPEQPVAADHWSRFVNEPDTDWSLPHNVDWIEGVLKRTWHDDVVPKMDSRPGGGSASSHWLDSRDVSHPERLTCRVRLLDAPEIADAVSVASEDGEWSNTTMEKRHAVLRAAAMDLRCRRGELIAAMVADAGKSVAEADPEVSEAIDFCEFYPLSMIHWAQATTIQIAPRGVVAVITPWNFPLAIAAGGVAAALSAGNRVLLKPSLETPLAAWLMCEAFWNAGVPQSALQFIACQDQDAENGLVRDRRIDTVVLTGGTETAKRMLSVRPDLHLLAETGGKNAMIVSAMADRDLAIKHVLQSAFGHSGQKCSATSLLLLEAEVFDDPVFRETLADATRSLPIGSSWKLESRVTPLVSAPNDTLMRGLKELDQDESWLVMPEHVEDHPTLYRPGIKWNVRPGSFTHVTELFGPVLGVMRYQRLEEAIQIVRSTGYGLTSGLESLDEREISLWKSSIPAGNLYINRATTGAIVLRQPFGGVGHSAYGPGVKAGGPHYVLALSRIVDKTPNGISVSNTSSHRSSERFREWFRQSALSQQVDPMKVDRAVASQVAAARDEFSQQHDDQKLLGQDNVRCYRSVDSMLLRVSLGDSLEDVLIALGASISVGTPLTVSLDHALSDVTSEALESLADDLPAMVEFYDHDDEQLAEFVLQGSFSRLRCFSLLNDQVATACAERFVSVVREPVLVDGRIECLRYLNEQSISHDTHRYGNLSRNSIRKEVVERT